MFLEWVTASESDNAGFTIERQTRPNVFEEIGFDGRCTTKETHAYRYAVVGLDPELHRFRFRQTDFDGTFAYSPIVALDESSID